MSDLSVIAIVTFIHGHFLTWPVIIVCALYFSYSVFYAAHKPKFTVNKQVLCTFLVSIFYFVLSLLIAGWKTLRYVLPVFSFFTVFFLNALNKNKIEYLFLNKPAEYIFTTNIATPVYIINKAPWKYADLVPYFDDDQAYYFIDGGRDIQLIEHEEFYLITEKGIEIPDIELAQFEKEGEFEVELFVGKKYIKRIRGIG